eukprot:3354410-Prymnesium_polylepis.1
MHASAHAARARATRAHRRARVPLRGWQWVSRRLGLGLGLGLGWAAAHRHGRSATLACGHRSPPRPGRMSRGSTTAGWPS